MGAFFSALFGSNELEDVELDWDNVNETDSALYNETAQLLERCKQMKSEIDNYEGAKTEISAAMAAALDECGPPTRIAFDLVSKNAGICLGWMETANIIATHLRDHILPHLKRAAPTSASGSNTNGDNGNTNDEHNGGGQGMAENKANETMVNESSNSNTNNHNNTNNNNNINNNVLSEVSLLTHGALCKQLCQLFDLMFEFDSKKMVTSQIQNDFAFYKRTLSKTQEAYMKGCDISVNSEKSGFISMFLAHGNPLVHEVSTQLKHCPDLNVLGMYCNTLLDLLKANKFKNDANSSKMVVRSMLVSFILFDHATENGAFHRRSGVKAQKVCVMIVREYEDIYGSGEDVANLDNSLRYSTLHFGDDTTPQSIKRLLAVN